MADIERFAVYEYITDEMKARGWDRLELCKRMGGDTDTNSLVLDFLEYLPFHPGLYLGETSAAQLAKAFGTSKELWLRLDRAAKQQPDTEGT